MLEGIQEETVIRDTSAAMEWHDKNIGVLLGTERNFFMAIMNGTIQTLVDSDPEIKERVTFDLEALQAEIRERNILGLGDMDLEGPKEPVDEARDILISRDALLAPVGCLGNIQIAYQALQLNDRASAKKILKATLDLLEREGHQDDDLFNKLQTIHDRIEE